ncbi:hypothetical protein BGZ61DRAFT_489310 [Ilyonectria robusta]|uniref:uncharacterized protein n=1 Tax=Ilyonectria robusta TaxID=1079257 RepID=UPI001E8CDFA1|nr:uncharacterized protein BGZ61DRAFT_489310 [Ilyonectria robusta]KAH8738383.1 hypothetical protein BGZ61DRAFT_489310 [Ilyonectria robusta]
MRAYDGYSRAPGSLLVYCYKRLAKSWAFYVLIPGTWVVEHGQSATGELVRHIIETHPASRDTIVEVERQDTKIYNSLSKYLQGVAEREWAALISYLAHGHFFYGGLWRNRSPVADANIRGTMIGIISDVSVRGRALCYCSTMFIALQTRHIVLMDLIAISRSVIAIIPHYVDAAVLYGAAMLIRATTARVRRDGETEDPRSIMHRMSKPGRVLKPNLDTNEKLLDVKYGVFLGQCRTQRECRRRVDKPVFRWHRGRD